MPSTNIDTDQIIPARFLTTTTREGLGAALFADWRYDADGQPRARLRAEPARGARLPGAGRRAQHRLRLVARARALGAARLRLPRGRQHRDRRHLPQQQPEERPAAGRRGRGHARVAARASRASRSRSTSPASSLRLPDGRAVSFPIEAFARYCLLNGVDELGYLLQQGRRHRRLRGAPGMKARITVLGGDGIGPEVTAEAVRVLQAVAARYGHEFEFAEALIGGAAIDASGSPLPPRTIDACRSCDAVLLGAVGGPKWSDPNAPRASRAGPARAAAHARPVRQPAPGARPSNRCSTPRRCGPRSCPASTSWSCASSPAASTSAARAARPTRPRTSAATRATEIERVTRIAGRLAMGRRRRIVSVDKANVLETSRLWRSVVERVIGEEFPDVAARAHAGRRRGHAPAAAADLRSTCCSPRTCSATS